MANFFNVQVTIVCKPIAFSSKTSSALLLQKGPKKVVHFAILVLNCTAQWK